MANPDLNRIRQEAADWVVALQECSADQHARLQAQCADWQAADPRHQQVLEQMQQMWQATDPAQTRRRKRRYLSTGLGSLLLMAWLGSHLPWAYWGADYRTASGEIRNLTLPDGSRIVLNSDSAIDLDYSDKARTLRLVRGELLVTVASDRERPFQVQTRHLTATALGTQYTVEQADTFSRVAVQESSVAVTPNDSGSPLTLSAGQRADLDSNGVIARETTPTYRPDWADGRLVFSNAPLPQVVERLGRHRTGLVRLSEELSHRLLHFTGVLPANDSDTALALLADSLDLQVQAFTPWYVTLTAGQHLGLEGK